MKRENLTELLFLSAIFTMANLSALSQGEERFCETIRAKDSALRAFLAANSLTNPININQWLRYLTDIKNCLGNLNDDLSFMATLGFKLGTLTALLNRKGAPGIDLECQAADGKRDYW